VVNPKVGDVICAPGAIEISDSGLPATDACLEDLFLYIISLHIPIMLIRLRLKVLAVFHRREASGRC
jgi:hypothetical protein